MPQPQVQINPEHNYPIKNSPWGSETGYLICLGFKDLNLPFEIFLRPSLFNPVFSLENIGNSYTVRHCAFEKSPGDLQREMLSSVVGKGS